MLSTKIPLLSINTQLPLLVIGLSVFGLFIFGSYQLIKDANDSRASQFSLPFSDVGNADWCSSSLQANLNSPLIINQLGGNLDFLTTQDCGDKVSLISQADWLAYGSIYQTSLGTTDYLPAGVTNVWTSTSVGDPASEQAYQIDQTGSLNPVNSDTHADYIPTVKLASTSICVTGTGASSDPYVVVADSLCDPPPTPPPTPSPTPTPTSTPGPSTTTCSSGYYLRDGSCQPNCNLTACKNCSSPNYCRECEEGYSLSGGHCVPTCSLANCVSCSAPNYCTACAPGYTSVSGVCQLLAATLQPASSPTPTSTPTLTPTHSPILVSSPAPVVVTATNNFDNGTGEQGGSSLLAHLGGTNFVPDLYSLAQLAGVSEVTLKSITNIVSSFFLPLLLILGLPLALLLAFFPLPRGRSLPGAIITVKQNNHSLTARTVDSSGNYWGFHLPVAKYSLQAKKKGIKYPPAVAVTNSSYHHNLYPDFFKTTSNRSATPPSPIFRLLNHLANTAPIIFITTLLLVFTYLTWPGVIAALAHLPWMIRRVALSVPKAKDPPAKKIKSTNLS